MMHGQGEAAARARRRQRGEAREEARREPGKEHTGHPIGQADAPARVRLANIVQEGRGEQVAIGDAARQENPAHAAEVRLIVRRQPAERGRLRRGHDSCQDFVAVMGEAGPESGETLAQPVVNGRDAAPVRAGTHCRG